MISVIRDFVYDKYNWKRILVFISVICLELNSFSQQPDYKRIFGGDWEKAEAFVTENESWMKQLSEKYDVSYPAAIAVAFPELIRYSALRDKMEITLLKTLYINLGEDYANFSIGQFQMKPSFAELVHKKIPLLKGKLKNQLKERTGNNDIRKYRTSIVMDLEQPEFQFLYLIAFIKICETIYNLKDLDEDQKIKFLAAAYNYSFQKSFEEVNEMIDKRFFYTKLVKAETYSYSDISAFWYADYQKNRQRQHW
jgi:hypothetical protein